MTQSAAVERVGLETDIRPPTLLAWYRLDIPAEDRPRQSPPGRKRGYAVSEKEVAEREASIATARCIHCDWEWRGPVGKGREKFRRHRCAVVRQRGLPG
jgi:hypothetical protein